MQNWLLELFGSRELNALFWLANASTVPFWVLMIFYPDSRLAKGICRLWLAPPILGFFYLYLLYLANDLTGLPELRDLEAKSVRRFWNHPVLFIALWMHKLVMDLFVGIWIARFAALKRWEIQFELILIWLLGPVGMAAFAIRYWIASAISWRQRDSGKKAKRRSG